MPDRPPMEDVHALTRAVAAGDADAFARLYDEHFDRLYRHARAFTGRDESFCLDVVQDAFTKVITSMPPLQETSELCAWLRRVVRSAAIDRLRSEQRRQRRERAVEGAVRDARRAEEHRWVAAELATMDARVATLIEQRFRFGWTLQRIAAAAGLSTGAVDGRIGRAVRTLRQRAREHFDD